MTNQEAIEIYKDLWRYEHSEFSEKEIREALEKGIIALENQSSVIEELENIWEKIRALPDINPDYPMDRQIHISRYEVQKIIYERLSELKGENKNDE